MRLGGGQDAEAGRQAFGVVWLGNLTDLKTVRPLVHLDTAVHGVMRSLTVCSAQGCCPNDDQ